jgi:5'-nucleotidase
LYCEQFLPRTPDLVVSGINYGINLGSDIFYSGTVAGAREAAMRGVSAIAFSIQTGGIFEAVASLARKIALAVIESPKPDGSPVLLNVNFPRGEASSVVVTRLSARIYESFVETRREPSGIEYHWIGGSASERGAFAGSDSDAIKRGLISITPLTIDAICDQHVTFATNVAEMCRVEKHLTRQIEER